MFCYLSLLSRGCFRVSLQGEIERMHPPSTLPSVGSGASDCASCVGVLLELARTLIANNSAPLPAPLLFLLNGAEETFLQVPSSKESACGLAW